MNRLDVKSGDYWSVPPSELAETLGSGPAGLSTSEANRRLGLSGPNELKVGVRSGPLRLLVGQFTSPLVLILLFAVVVSVFASEWTDAVVILTIVVASGLISFWQEFSADNAVARLRERLTHMVSVVRDGAEQVVPARSVVPGDLLVLAAGSLIPADGVVIEATDCFVNQAILTGETYPVEKHPNPSPLEASLSERENCVYMCTSARSGTAKMLVVRTGDSTE